MSKLNAILTETDTKFDDAEDFVVPMRKLENKLHYQFEKFIEARAMPHDDVQKGIDEVLKRLDDEQRTKN